MKKRICQMAALGSVLLLAFSAPVQAAAVTTNGTPAAVATNNIQNWPAGPETTSEAAVLIDADTGAVLYDKGMNECRYPASTTKLMTILLATENSSPRDIVTFTETGIRDVTWDSSNINAQLGEQMTMKDCWFAAYIKSANEVCAQIAEYVGGSEANFVDMMNQRAKELGCTHTHFANASGLPDENHYSSALDLAKIMRAGLQNARFRKVIERVGYTIPATNLSESRPMHTHMPLMAKESDLYYEGCIGGKTGFANEAEHTLVVAAERNGRTYIAVTMRAADLGINCTDSTALFDYAFNNFDTIDVNGTKMTVPAGATVNDLTTESVDRNGKTMNRYYYNGQYVGYVVAADPTPTPTEAPQNEEEATADISTDQTAEQTETAVQDSQTETKELSQTSKILLGVMAEQGFEPALAAGGLGGYAALGICLAVAVFAKNSGDKATAGSAAFTNALCGITEPGLYGIILRSKWLLGTMVFFGAAAGLVFGIGGVAATNFAFTGILAFSGWLGCVNFPMYCVGIVVAIALGFGITAFLLKSGKVKVYN